METSFVAFLRSMGYLLHNPLALAAGDTPGELLATSQRTGRRYQHPTFFAAMVQIGLAIFFGLLIAYIFYGRQVGFQQSSSWTLCLLSLLSPLNALDGVSHEIQVLRYLYPSNKKLLASVSWLAQRTVFPAIFLPILAIAVSYLLSFEIPENLAGMYVRLAFHAALVIGFLRILDESIQIHLFNPRPNLKTLVDELDDDSTPLSRLDVILQSLLGKSIANEVWKPIPNDRFVVLEQEEVRRNERLMQDLSVEMTKKGTKTEWFLEEDVLRILILESLGGRNVHQSMLNIQEWIEYKFDKALRSKVESIGLVLLRGLCVYASGLGEAIVSRTTPRPSAEIWSLSPSGVACAEFVVTAIGRCLSQKLAPGGRALSDWKSTDLSTIAVTALISIYRLRYGIVFYGGQYRPGSTDALQSISVSHPDLVSVIEACDQAGAAILSHIDGQVDLPMDVLAWAKTVL